MNTNQKVWSIFILLIVSSIALYVLIAAFPVLVVSLIMTLCFRTDMQRGNPDAEGKYRTARIFMRISGIVVLIAGGFLAVVSAILFL